MDPNLITRFYFVVVFLLLFFVVVFLVDPKTALIGPSSACQRNAIEKAFRWRGVDGPTLNAGLVAL